jgi:hypothetical protein
MERCPSCSARLKESLHCPRCKADLELVFASEKLARFWCSKAIEFWQQQEIALAVLSLKKSLDLKQTELGLKLCDFMIVQQCKQAVAWLTKEDWGMAERTLQTLSCFQNQSQQVKQLQGFIEFLRSDFKVMIIPSE